MNSTEITTAEKMRRLPWNIALSATNNVFAQLTIFGSVFILFLNDLGATNSQIGLLLSMLPFSGMVALFIAPRVARFGYKRTFVTFFGIRKIIAGGLLLTPWVVAKFGGHAALLLVTAVMLGFSLCRAIAETGLYPWAQEYIPNSIRGRHAAVNGMLSRVTGIIAIAVGGYILGLSTGLDRYNLLFAIGLVFGLMAVWSASHLPGGAPSKAQTISYRGFLGVLHDKNFSQYMIGLGLATLGAAPLAFLPLFMQKEVGLNDSTVVWLQIGTILGGLSATYLMGWAADRYGSKPVLLVGLYFKALLPLGWLLMPRNSPLSLAVALAIAAVWGVVEIGWTMGSGRLLFTRVVPLEKKGEYMAVFYAAIGLIGGISQIASGALLDATSNISGRFLVFPVDQFTPLFFGSAILIVLSIVVFSRVNPDSNVSVGEFTGMFIHGNPVLALELVMRYYRAKDERSTVVMTERLGQTKSPLTVEELLEALTDPRFNVRFEAIISIARMGSEPRLVDALCGVLDGTEISLSVVAAWALGRMGDEKALPSLRNGLHSAYRSIQAHCARSLGTLDDTESAPELLERLQSETDKGLRIAFSSALGNLRWEAALPTLFNVLETTENEGARMELALAIARIVDGEQQFIRLRRGLRQDCATSTAQAVTALKRRRNKSFPAELDKLFNQCANDFARDQLDEGAEKLGQIIDHLVVSKLDDISARILAESADKLRQFRASRLEYLMLVLLIVQMPANRQRVAFQSSAEEQHSE